MNTDPMMKPVKKKKVYEEVVDQFAHKFETGQYKDGDRLPTERELAEMMGVSRTSIREALRAMELIGMVESRVGDGTYVKSLQIDTAFSGVINAFHADTDFILDMYEVRILLETYTIRIAAKNRTTKQLEQLQQALDNIDKDIQSNRPVISSDNQFHQIIAEAAGNRALLSILALCADLFNSSIELANAQVNALDIQKEHHEMYTAILNQDSALAARLMKAHLRRAHKRAILLMKMGNMD